MCQRSVFTTLEIPEVWGSLRTPEMPRCIELALPVLLSIVDQQKTNEALPVVACAYQAETHMFCISLYLLHGGIYWFSLMYPSFIAVRKLQVLSRNGVCAWAWEEHA